MNKRPKDRAKTIKLLKENREKLHDIDISNDFLNMTPKHRQQK